MPIDLRYGERAPGNDGNPIATGFIDCLANHASSDLAAAENRGDFRVVDDYQSLARPAVGHLRFDTVDDQPVASLRDAVLPLYCSIGRGSRRALPLGIWRPHLKRLSRYAL